MYTKMEITGEIEVLTGMHIGGSAQFSAIGAIDSPVVRDVESDLPMIPGSSLKGKLRTLLARKYCEGLPQEPNKDPVEILRLFGSSEKQYAAQPVAVCGYGAAKYGGFAPDWHLQCNGN